MRAKIGGMRRALVLAALLAASAPAVAGPFKKHGTDCPPSSYSHLHYWAPNLYRLKAHFHAPANYVYTPDRHPHITPSYDILAYPCPAEEPATIYSQRYWSQELFRKPQAPSAKPGTNTP